MSNDTTTNDEQWGVGDPPVETKVRLTKEKAEADRTYDLKCIMCKSKVVFIEHDKAVDKGHIYSEAGRWEFVNSKLCEWCFDDLTLPEDEPGD